MRFNSYEKYLFKALRNKKCIIYSNFSLAIYKLVKQVMERDISEQSTRE